MTSQQVRGVVARSTETGLQLQEFAGVWFNRSRPQWDKTGGMPFPGDGSEVELVYEESQGRRYVQQFTVLSAGQPGPGPEPVQVLSRNGAASATSPHGLVDDRPVVTRLACLNAAVRLAAAYPEVGGEQPELSVKMLAERFATWVISGMEVRA